MALTTARNPSLKDDAQRRAAVVGVARFLKHRAPRLAVPLQGLLESMGSALLKSALTRTPLEENAQSVRRLTRLGD